MNQTPEKLLHERDAAEILGMSIAWMQKARYLDNGPRYVKVAGEGGRAVRYRQSDLIAYINENLVETADTRRTFTRDLKAEL
jgi:predicted DNA-binding transcriptional regulator AlpA